MPARRFTNEEEVFLYKDYCLNNYTIKDLAIKYNSSKTTIIKYLRKYGIRIDSTIFDESEQKRIVWLYTIIKYNTQKISDIYNVNRITINKILKSNGINITRGENGKHNLSEKIQKEICNEYNIIKDCSKISKKYRLAHSTIRKILCKHGVNIINNLVQTIFQK